MNARIPPPPLKDITKLKGKGKRMMHMSQDIKEREYEMSGFVCNTIYDGVCTSLPLILGKL
jgi:hypothetical protein